MSKKVAFQYAWENRPDSEFFNDCSGKHAGMLAVSKLNGYNIGQYTSPGHPVQKEISAILAQMAMIETKEIKLGIDGCSVPVHAMPIYNMALAYANFANPEKLNPKFKKAAERIYSAMMKHPEMIAGTEGFCTELIKNTNGKLIGKIGAEGIYCVGIKDKDIGIAVKIESGSMDVLPPVVMHVLENLELLDKNELKSLEKFRIMNNINDVNKVVGKMYPVFHLSQSRSF